MSARLVRDQDQSDAVLCEGTEIAPQLGLREEIETVGGLIEQQGPRVVHQGPGNQDPGGFARGESGDKSVREVGDTKPLQRGGRLTVHVGRDFAPLLPQPDAAEEPGEDDIPAGEGASDLLQQVRRDDAKAGTKLLHMPLLPTEKAGHASRLVQWIEFAGDGLDQRRLAGAVRPQHRDVFSLLNPEREIKQSRAIASQDGEMLEVEHAGKLIDPVQHQLRSKRRVAENGTRNRRVSPVRPVARYAGGFGLLNQKHPTVVFLRHTFRSLAPLR